MIEFYDDDDGYSIFLSDCCWYFLGPSTWALAVGKNDMMTILISKLIDDGISLYKVDLFDRQSIKIFISFYLEKSNQRSSLSIFLCY